MLKPVLRRILNRWLESRARVLARLLAPHLPPHGRLLDIGAGTGHNARALRASSTCGQALEQALEVVEADVVDMTALDITAAPFERGLVLFDGRALPFADASFDAALLLFVLQYPACPEQSLREAARVARGRVLLLQTTYRGPLGLALLRVHDWAWGSLALRVARAVGLVPTGSTPMSTPMSRPRLLSEARLRRAIAGAGLRVRAVERAPRSGRLVRRRLFVLEARE